MPSILKNANLWWIVGLALVLWYGYQHGIVNTSPPAGQEWL